MDQVGQQAFANVMEISSGFVVSRAAQVCVEVGVADALGAEPLSAADIAGRTSTHPDGLARLLRQRLV